jgi:hypothetical protein
MIDDPIVSLVHQARESIFAECNGDLERLILRLKTADLANKDRHVTLSEVERKTKSSEAAS